MSDQHESNYLTVSQVADMWCVSEDVIYAAIKKGSLRAYRVGASCLRVLMRDAVSFGVPVSAPAMPPASSSGGQAA